MSMSTNDALRVTSELVGQRLRGHDSELEKLAAQTAAHEVRLAVLEAKPSTAGPINEAGITATFAAIFARLEELEHGQEDHHARLGSLESARIAAPVAPESVETASEVAQEPGNATERICGTCGYQGAAEDCTPLHATPRKARLVELWDCDLDADEICAALSMYRKVQGCIDKGDGEVQTPIGVDWYATAAGLLAWLKEGEAQ